LLTGFAGTRKAGALPELKQALRTQNFFYRKHSTEVLSVPVFWRLKRKYVCASPDFALAVEAEAFLSARMIRSRERVPASVRL
jgi:hypothetical protein